MTVKRNRNSGPKKAVEVKPVGGVGPAVAPSENNGGQRSLYVQVADRAYYIWIEKGKPDRGAMNFWFQAEAEVRGEQVQRFGGRHSVG